MVILKGWDALLLALKWVECHLLASIEELLFLLHYVQNNFSAVRTASSTMQMCHWSLQLNASFVTAADRSHRQCDACVD